jgi:hypothetical protein
VLAVAFLAKPAFTHAATASATDQVGQTQTSDVTDITSPMLEGKSLLAKKTAVQNGLDDISQQLTDLSSQTQLAISQLTLNNLDTTEAQTDLMYANASLAEAKTDITIFDTITISPKLSPVTNLANLKDAADTAQNSLTDAKKHLVDSLTDLQEILPNVTDATQQ